MWLVVGFVLFVIVPNPSHAAVLARHLGNGLGDLASGVSAFIDALAGAR
jgi:hypothetical protein